MNDTAQITEADRYSRFRQMNWWNGEIVRSATAVVAGAGALGNEVVKNLLLLGWGRIVLVDFDAVEASNLTRSILFRASDIGKTKLQAACDAARDINPGCRIEPIQGDLRLALGAGVVKRSDIVFGCLDNLEARLALSELAGRTGVPMIDGGLSEWDGTVSLYCPPEGPCFGCGLDGDDLALLGLRRSCGLYAQRAALRGGVPTTPVVSSIIAGLMVQQGLKYVHGMVEGARLPFGHQIRVDTAFNRSWCYALPRNPACPFHPCREDADTVAGVNDAASWRSILERVRALVRSPSAVLHLPQPILEEWHCPWCDAHAMPMRFHVLGEPVYCPSCGVAVQAVFFNQVTGDESWLDATPAQTELARLAWITVVDDTSTRSIEISQWEAVHAD